MENVIQSSIYQLNEDYYNVEEYKINELIEEARILLEKKDFKLAEFYLTLARLEPKIDYSNKIRCYAMTSLIRQFFNDDRNLIEFILKIVKYLKEKPIKLFDVPLAYFIIKILYRAGIILHQNQNYFMSVFLLKYSKNLIVEKGLEGEEKNKESLDKLIDENINKIRISLEPKLVLFEKRDEKLIEKLNNLKKIICDLERNNSVQKPINEDSTSINGNKFLYVHIISSTWCNKALDFIEEYLNKYSMRSVNDLFDVNKIITKFSIFENESRKINQTYGIYPGPINNFGLLRGKEILDFNNPTELFNLKFSKSLSLNQDFYILYEDQWKLINEIFGSIYCIKRIYYPHIKLVEIYPKEIDILIINENLKKNDVSQIKINRVLLCKFDTISQIKEKIKENLERLLKKKNYNEEERICVFKKVKLFRAIEYKRKLKRSLINLIYNYKLNYQKYRIFGYVIENDNKKFDEIEFNEERDILIVDVDANYIDIDKTLRKDSIMVDCLKCKKLIDKEKLINCPNCQNFQYCSENCYKSDDHHRQFHSLIKKFTFPKLNLKELISIKLEDIIEKNSCFGRVGLKNLGNTCFMNSAIQCLSHCEDLTKYFILKHHLKDINSQNKYGSNGRVASAYWELIIKLWNGSSKNLSPGEFRQILVKIINKFQGFSQQDSHELLTYLLDSLHEDLNRVAEKPYIEMKEKLNLESDVEGSNRWWKNHLRRENSIIVDLFHGQYKSTIRCPECRKISITYDPFMYLGLPIPNNQTKVIIKYFPNFFKDLKHEYFNIEINVNFNNLSYYSIKDIKLEIHERYGIRKNNKILIQYPMSLFCYEAVLLEKDKIFKKILTDDAEILQLINDGKEIVIYEKFHGLEQIKNKNNYSTYFFNPIFLDEKTSLYFFTKKIIINLYYPVLVTISNDSLLYDLYYLIFLIYRKIIPEKEIEVDLQNLLNSSKKIVIDPKLNKINSEITFRKGYLEIEKKKKIQSDIIDFSRENIFEESNNSKNIFYTNIRKFMEVMKSKSEDESYLIEEFRCYFTLNESYDLDKHQIPFELFFLNNITDSNEYKFYFFNKKNYCEFCGLKNCEICPVSPILRMNDKVCDLNQKLNSPRQLCFFIGFKNFLNLKLFNNDNFPFDSVNIAMTKNRIGLKTQNEADNKSSEIQNCEIFINKSKNKILKNFSIYDSLNLFNKEEKLERDNMWYCSNCKKHQEALKKMEIYKPPHILIVQFKRFKTKSHNTYVNKSLDNKNETLVEFPLEGLDIGDYIVGENSNNAVYDLFSIIQHFGDISSGHYTSFCKNKREWIEFDDETINIADHINVINKNAYLLFYKIRNIEQ